MTDTFKFIRTKSQFKNPYPKKLPIIEYTLKTHLVFAMVHNETTLITIDCCCRLELYTLTDIIRRYEPTDD